MALSASVSGCSTRGGALPYDGALLGTPDLRAPEEPGYDIPLGPLDVVNVRVFRVPDLSGDYQVDAKGIVAMPLLGPVSVRDMRPDAFASELQRLYAARYLNDPDISVRVVSTNAMNVTIEGGVTQSGVYPLPGRTTLLGAIALAKGLNEDAANPRRSAIFRKQEGKTVAAAFDLIAIQRGEMADPLVYPGDTVIVESNDLRKVYRDLVQSLPAFTIFRTL
ncbi:polysaccharide biosynthesis/export family protein [Sphingomonas hengshuiensis]|uniref:polysaccharide biosynthesis/export family protein n=1 Tax=Sphingomonas hengshuiensis TaxID=1609977 RepID=UPI0006991518|nr:polysaccharide biosynthesis/export family protein [Sphingomonas hengshuiensis]